MLFCILFTNLGPSMRQSPRLENLERNKVCTVCWQRKKSIVDACAVSPPSQERMTPTLYHRRPRKNKSSKNACAVSPPPQEAILVQAPFRPDDPQMTLWLKTRCWCFVGMAFVLYSFLFLLCFCFLETHSLAWHRAVPACWALVAPCPVAKFLTRNFRG